MNLDNRERVKTALFAALMGACLWPRVGTPLALSLGIAFSLTLGSPVAIVTSEWSKRLLQISVVGLGFGIGIGQVLNEGRHSIPYTIVGIAFALAVGALLGRLFGVDANISRLISFGTAICGGSAIAAMAPVLRAKSEEVAVALATVFTLNSVALLVFPPIGHALHMSQQSFGLWAALAIHDTSSVVGAASAYGPAALATGVTVKLTRALWIMPAVIATALFRKSGQKVTVPMFIFGFIAAAVIRSLIPGFTVVWDGLAFIGKRLLVVTLFLIGAGLSREVLKKIGVYPLAQGVALWLAVSVATLVAIVRGLIG